MQIAVMVTGTTSALELLSKYKICLSMQIPLPLTSAGSRMCLHNTQPTLSRISSPQLLHNSAMGTFSSELQMQSREGLRYTFNITYVADMSCKF